MSDGGSHSAMGTSVEKGLLRAVTNTCGLWGCGSRPGRESGGKETSRGESKTDNCPEGDIQSGHIRGQHRGSWAAHNHSTKCDQPHTEKHISFLKDNASVNPSNIGRFSTGSDLPIHPTDKHLKHLSPSPHYSPPHTHTHSLYQLREEKCVLLSP